MFEEIKKLKDLPLKLKESQVAKQLNIDTRTVKKYWNMAEKEFLDLCKKYFDNKSKSALDIYKEEILTYLNTYKDFTAAQIYDRLKENHINFNLCESTVRNYVAKLREKYGLNKEIKPREYVAVEELPMGKQAQVDFGEITLFDTEHNPVKLWVFAMVLSHSRYKYGVWQDKPFNAKDFVNAHEKAFKYFGGIPEEIVYDRTKVALNNENSDGTFKLCETFAKYVEEVKFKPKFCKAYDPESKGKIEAVVKYIKYNFAKHRTFKEINSFNTSFYKWLERTGNTKIHDTTKKVPAEVFSLERQYLNNKHLHKDIPIIHQRVKKDNTISFSGNRYSLPKGTFTNHKEVVINIINNLIEIKTLELNLIVSYKIPTGKGVLVQKNPYQNLTNKEITEIKNEVFEKFKNNKRIIEFIERLIISDPKNIRRNLIKFQNLEKDILLSSLITAVEYSFAKQDFSLATFTLKAKQFDQREKETDKLNKIENKKEKIYEVITRDISEYQSIQEDNL